LANTKSALKMMRVAERRRMRNKPVRSAAKTYISRAEKLIALQDKESARAAVIKAVSVLDKAAEKGIIHPNNAARRKSRLMRKFNLMGV
jgi:small subunit ribosomal protein S20